LENEAEQLIALALALRLRLDITLKIAAPIVRNCGA
jgi:hypothetical protein